MTKVTGPMHSDKASGAFRDEVIFSTWRGRAYSKRYAKPAQPPSLARSARQAMARAVPAFWREMSAAGKAAWAEAGKVDDLPGYHAFMRAAHRGQSVGKALQRTPGGKAGALLPVPGGVTIKSDGEHVRATWTEPTGAYGVVILISEAPMAQPAGSAMQAFVPAGTGKAAVSVAAGTYRVRVAAFDATGQVGKMSTETTVSVGL